MPRVKWGEGTTFIIELPIVAEEEEKIERVETVEEAGKVIGGRDTGGG